MMKRQERSMTEHTSRKKTTLGWLGLLTLVILVVGWTISLSRRTAPVILFEARPVTVQRKNRASRIIKRIIDFSAALVALILG
jgi:hypothetical protein